MLIFNCTRAAADFFTRTRKGEKESPLLPPPAEAVTGSGTAEQPVSQWLLHAVSLRHKPVLIAMNIHTRYAMVFPAMKRGDWETFLAQFMKRLFSNLSHYAALLALCHEEAFKAQVTRFAACHTEILFCCRGDRSTQGHMNDVAGMFADVVAESAALPGSDEQCAGFDEWVNRMLRSVKQQKGYFTADEKMLTMWLTVYGTLTESAFPLISRRFDEFHRAAESGAAEQQAAEHGSAEPALH